MFRRRISKLWLGWAIIVGALCVIWMGNVGSMETCLHDTRRGTYWCLGDGVLAIDGGLSNGPAAEPRFELESSFSGHTTTDSAFRIPLLLPAVAVFFGVPGIVAFVHVRRRWSNRPGRKPRCPRCGWRGRVVEARSCPKCRYTADADSNRDESAALPCPACQYDLRGLADGNCPECGTSFVAAQLEPEQPGLVLETWYDRADALRSRIALPWCIAWSPIRAFRRHCSTNRILLCSPARTFLWSLLWFAAILVAGVGIRYSLDTFQGMRVTIGGYWHDPRTFRFGSALVAPVHVLIAWLECLLVACIGMAIAFRSLSARQAARLATWLFALTLLAGAATTVYELIYYEVIVPTLYGLPLDYAWVRRIQDLGNALTYRFFDLVLGLSAGLAVGTALQRRRWLAAITAAIVLAAAFPAWASIQGVYWVRVCRPIHELVVGPPQRPAVDPTLLVGPTFRPGTTVSALAGMWSVRYEGSDEPELHLTFDEQGSLTRLRVGRCAYGDPGDFVADGERHAANLPGGMKGLEAADYRVLSGAEYLERAVVLHLRLERTYTLRVRDDLTTVIPEVVEESLSGNLSGDGTVITGTSVMVRESPGVNFGPAQLERSFVMERVPPPRSSP